MVRSTLALALLLVGCGAGVADDAGLHVDAAADTSIPVDTSVPRDTSVPFDAIIPTDSSLPFDMPAHVDASSVGSAGCGLTGAVTGFRTTVHFTTSGADRTYAISVPAGYDTSRPYPLVFAFHGDGGTGSGLRGAFGLETPGAGAAIFVYPDATVASGQSWDLETPLATNADIVFFTELVADLEAHYCVDAHRVFAAGFSRGAFFANILNCRVGDTVLRAIAAHSGSIYSVSPTGYDADGYVVCEGHAAAALLIHGMTDSVVPITDGMYADAQWTHANHCAATTTPVPASPCVVHDGCDADRPVEWCAIPSLGHAIWSSAATTIWDFFAART